jgi:hypothetical protein
MGGGDGGFFELEEVAGGGAEVRRSVDGMIWNNTHDVLENCITTSFGPRELCSMEIFLRFRIRPCWCTMHFGGPVGPFE